MPCILTDGRLRPCSDAVGGIRKLHFVDFGSLGDVTLTDDEITDLAGTFDYYTYDVKGNSSLETTVNKSVENGTTFFDQKLNVTLHKLTKEDNKELKVLIYGRPHVFVEDYKGNVMCVGLENGADVTGGTAVTGAAMGDLNGYTLELTGSEIFYPNFVDSPTSADPFAGMLSATATAATQREPTTPKD
jgi:hypothetical protein